MTLESHRSTPRPDPLQLAAKEREIPWAALETLIHLDPAGRGLASFRTARQPVDAGQLHSAALDVAQNATAVCIVTGFCAVVGDRVTAETDGPPGALFLARALLATGVDVTLMTDRYGLPLVEAGCDAWGLDRRIICKFPSEDERATGTPLARWIDDFLAPADQAPWSHLIAIERPGPSHTGESLAAQPRNGPAPRARFLAEVPQQDRNVCHNMRGHSIDRYTGKTHLLFDRIHQLGLPITSIGIGDGGNEIGMGRFPWEVLVEAVGGSAAGRIACRIATDFTLVAGVSNWAAYALALTVARLCGPDEPARDWGAAGQRRLIETIVAQTSAVDGVTLKHEPTVDGLPLPVYLETLVALRSTLGYDDATPP